MRVELITAEGRPPKPMDVIVTISHQLGGPTTAYTEETRSFYARHFIALPWSLFKWSMRIGWIDLKGMVRGAPKRPLETVADALEREQA